MSLLRSRALALILVCASVSAYSLDVTLDGSFTAGTETPNPLWGAAEVRASHALGDFAFLWDVSVATDGQYGGFFGGRLGVGGATIRIKEGGLSWTSERLSIQAGRLAMADEIDSPYSLFLSGRDNAALNLLVRYEDERFFFDDRWIALNYNSFDEAWPDRSAVIKNYGVKLGSLRFGFQDAIVYTDKAYLGSVGSPARGAAFEPEYFFNPAPAVLIQYVYQSTSSPWKIKDLNDNSLMGFFGVLDRGNIVFNGQILIDDINLNRFLHPSDYQNPDKIAWTFGTALKTNAGSFRFDQAGATKYTFQPFGNSGENTDYGYTFYPDTQFMMDGVGTAIDPESNYLGYLHGENNLAFMLSWAGNPGTLSGRAALEFTISGSKSPANPWGRYLLWEEGGQGPKFLDDPILEKKLVLGGRAELALGGWILYTEAKAGWVWNRLKLTSMASAAQTTLEPDTLMAIDRVNGIPIYYPSSESGPIGAITLGAKLMLKQKL